MIITIIVLLILAGITINSLTGSDSAPAKANEAAQKNDIGTAKDEISLLAVNAKTEGYETAYVGNGVSAGDASKTVGQAVIDAVKAKNGTNVGKASIEVLQAETNSVKGDATITITTRDFEVEGTITINDGILTWGKIEENKPRIVGVPTHLEIGTDELPYTINATLKGTTGTSITWSNGGSTVVDVSNGTLSLITNISSGYVTANITASADGCESKTCAVKITKVVTPQIGDVVNYAPGGTYSWDCNLAESGRNANTATNTLSSGENGTHRITQWKILNYNSSTKMVEMVPKDVPTDSSANKLTLRGAQGYNNAVYLLNNACNSLYGNGTTITARSINEEDFINASAIDTTDTDNGGNKWLNYREKTYENSSVKNANNTNVKYGQQKDGAYTSSSYRNYPVMYAYDYNSVITPEPTLSTATASLAKSLGLSVQNNPISKTQDSDSKKDGYKKASTSIQPYQTYYNTNNNSTTRGLLDSAKADVLVPNSNSKYWVASRCVNLISDNCCFDVRIVYSGYLNANNVFDSDAYAYYTAFALFPVVSLSSELLEPSTTSGVAWEVDAN